MNLIIRICKCGCGKWWKTLATSKWFYWDREHALLDGWKPSGRENRFGVLMMAPGLGIEPSRTD